MRTLQIIFFFSILISTIGCHRKQMHKTSGIKDAGDNDLTTASPNSCIVIAEVLSVYPVDTTQKDSWCGKFPCTAILKVVEIKQCGSASTGIVDTESGIEVRFVFTLAATEKVDADIPVFLPGLKEGDKILTSLHIHPSLGGGTEYSVYSYKVL